MKKQYKSKWVIVLGALFVVIAIASSLYLFSSDYTMSVDNKMITNLDKNKSKDIALVAKDSVSRENILDSLSILKAAYDVVLLEKTSLSEELEMEKMNVERLMEVINSSDNPTSSQIQVYRKQLKDLKLVLNSKLSEINALKSQNKTLLTELENQNLYMYKQKIVSDSLVSQGKKMESTIKKAAKLELNNFRVVGLQNKDSGREIETDKAKNTDKLKVSFSVLPNALAKTGKTFFYVQVLDQQNNVLGENKLIEFDEKTALVYSFLVSADYQGKAVNVYGILNSDIPFTKGTYFVNFFDKRELVQNTSITLK